MKKLVLTSVLAFSLASFGAPKKIATVQLADVDSLVQGVAKLGEFTGNQMLGLMASQLVTKLPWIDLFGMARPGVPTSFFLYHQDGKTPSCVILYPIATSKAEFLESHSEAKEEDGLLSVTIGESEKRYAAAFSKGGQWVAMGDPKDGELIKAALSEVKSASRKMDGDLVKLMVTPRGMENLLEDLPDEAATNELVKIMREVSACAIGIGVNDRGLDIRGALKPVKGSDLEKIGRVAIAKDAWETIDAKAIGFSLVAEQSGRSPVEFEELRAILAEYKISLDFLSVIEKRNNYLTMTFDAEAVCKYLNEHQAELKKVDWLSLSERLSTLERLPDGQLYDLKSPAQGSSVIIKGYQPIAHPTARFEATLPEVKDKPCSSVSFLPVYSIFKAEAPLILKQLKEEERQMFAPMLAALPSEGKGGIATATWFERGSHRFFVRIGADEFKGVSSVVAAVMAIQMQNAMQMPSPVESEKK